MNQSQNITEMAKVFRLSSDIGETQTAVSAYYLLFPRFPSDFPYQAARSACGKGRPPHMADEVHSTAVCLL